MIIKAEAGILAHPSVKKQFTLPLLKNLNALDRMRWKLVFTDVRKVAKVERSKYENQYGVFDWWRMPRQNNLYWLRVSGAM